MPSIKQIVNDFVENRFNILTAKNKRRLPKIPPPPSIKTLQVAYYKDLRSILKYLSQLIKDIVMPRLQNLLILAKTMRPDRMDDYSDEINDLFETVKDMLYRTYPIDKIAQTAFNAAMNTSAKNAKYLQKIEIKIAGINYAKSEPWIKQEIKAFVTQNTDLITKMMDEQIARVKNAVLTGVSQGWRHEEIAKEIMHTNEIAENKAALIARDQCSKFNAALTQYRYKEAGIEKYEWSTAGDERVRDSHAACDGHIFTWDDDLAVDDSGVKKPEGYNPGEDINCRCAAIPVIEEEEIE